MAYSGVHSVNFTARFQDMVKQTHTKSFVSSVLLKQNTTQHTSKYHPLRMAYASLPKPEEYNTVSYVQCSPGVTAKHDIVERRLLKS